MKQEELQTILSEHKKWLEDKTTGKRANLCFTDRRCANLSYANLRCADLTHANLTHANLTRADLSYADLTHANLRYANLTRADLDFSCLPLWCGGLDFAIDEKIARQVLYHLLSLCKKSDLMPELFTKEIVAEANKFHRVGEVTRI